MKIGLSTYSLLKDIESGKMDILDVVEWVAKNGGTHMEIVPYGFSLIDNLELADQVKEKSTNLGLELSNYAIPSNFVHDSIEDFNEEIERIKKHVDLAKRMGINHMRHDVIDFTLDQEKSTVDFFEENLEKIVEGCQIIADYASQFNITTSVENHSVCVQGSERVQRVLKLVDRPNFKTVLDIGNFLCVDEQPLVGLKKNLPYASIIHFKDFYIRPYYENPGEGEWFKTTNGNYLRGSILGHGDIEIREVIRLIEESGFDGYITIEFEGMEECQLGSRLSINNLKRLFNEE